MTAAVIVALQLASPFDLDLVDERCDGPHGEQIVVCAETDGASPYRLPGAEPLAPDLVPRAQFRLSEGITAGSQFESYALPNGVVSNRIMARFKIEF